MPFVSRSARLRHAHRPKVCAHLDFAISFYAVHVFLSLLRKYVRLSSLSMYCDLRCFNPQVYVSLDTHFLNLENSLLCSK